MRLSIIAAALLVLPWQSWGEETDYRALYLRANEAAAKWKARAEELAAQLDRQKFDLEIARKQLAVYQGGGSAPAQQQQGQHAEATVGAQIRKMAAERWPGDYRMQEFVIEQQTEAYRKLHPGGK
jgi:hypothetical protein